MSSTTDSSDKKTLVEKYKQLYDVLEKTHMLYPDCNVIFVTNRHWMTESSFYKMLDSVQKPYSSLSGHEILCSNMMVLAAIACNDIGLFSFLLKQSCTTFDPTEATKCAETRQELYALGYYQFANVFLDLVVELHGGPKRHVAVAIEKGNSDDEKTTSSSSSSSSSSSAVPSPVSSANSSPEFGCTKHREGYNGVDEYDVGDVDDIETDLTQSTASATANSTATTSSTASATDMFVVVDDFVTKVTDHARKCYDKAVFLAQTSKQTLTESSTEMSTETSTKKFGIDVDPEILWSDFKMSAEGSGILSLKSLTNDQIFDAAVSQIFYESTGPKACELIGYLAVERKYESAKRLIKLFTDYYVKPTVDEESSSTFDKSKYMWREFIRILTENAFMAFHWKTEEKSLFQAPLSTTLVYPKKRYVGQDWTDHAKKAFDSLKIMDTKQTRSIPLKFEDQSIVTLFDMALYYICHHNVSMRQSAAVLLKYCSLNGSPVAFSLDTSKRDEMDGQVLSSTFIELMQESILDAFGGRNFTWMQLKSTM